MKKHLVLGLLAAFCATPALAALKPGDMAPDFTAQGSLGGKDFTFHLKDALKKGPVVVYFYPSAYTGGCDLEAHTFAEQSDKFAAAGASIIGVSADDLTRLKRFSADPNFCAGKFPIASDADTKIAQSYALNVTPPKVGATDVNKDEIGHAFIERVTYVVGKDGKIIAVMSSKADGLSPDQHVDKSLAIVTASK
ncbi:MAG TPA: peroxiredoxin [Rhizomicrobium sp.]|jgi:peroxiredoxin|nr:peroxiredoxin [Rhizomicrobium sp.]